MIAVTVIIFDSALDDRGVEVSDVRRVVFLPSALKHRRECLIQIDQHDHNGLRRTACQDDGANRHGDAHVEPHEIHQSKATRECKGHRQHDIQLSARRWKLR